MVAASTTWSRVEEGFFVASRAGDFLGVIEQRGPRFHVFDGRGEPVAQFVGLADAMDALTAAPVFPPPVEAPADGLVTVVYTSLATTRFDDERLARLLYASRAANADADVTGVLLYRDGRFLQVLEGREHAVDAVMTRIAKDARHHGIRVLVDQPLAERRFGEWSMAYRPWTTPVDELPGGFRDTFDDLDDAEALRAVRELMLWFRHRPDRADLVVDDGD